MIDQFLFWKKPLGVTLLITKLMGGGGGGGADTKAS